MKVLKLIAPAVLALTATLANAGSTMDAHQADKTATKIREATYSCASGGKVTVRYGFNKQNLPTYAQAKIDGKARFMPINLAHSDDVQTDFGDENTYSLGTEAMTLKNYHKLNITNIQDNADQITHKNCKVISTKKIKG